MPTLISNENYAIRWDKTDCNNYTITNLSNKYNAHVTITDKTGTWVEVFDLLPLGSNTVLLPGDGVFEICAYLFDVPIDIEPVERTLPYVSYALVPDVPGMIAKEIKMISPSGVITTISLNFPAGFNFPLQSSNILADIQTYLNANGGGFVYLLNPGDTEIPGVITIDNDLDKYKIVIQANNTLIYSYTYENGSGLISTKSYQFCSFFYEIPESSPYIFSLVISGNEIIPVNTFYNMSVQEDIDALIDLIQNNIGPNDNVAASLLQLSINISSEVGNDEPIICPIVTLESGKFGPGETQCDYIYEFCDLYACLSRLMNRWLCQDPCADKCTAAGESYEEARRKAVELSTMFFHALMPLVTTDRLWYFGNWDISDQRLCNVNNIFELYKKMRDYVKNCGFDCGCGCPDNCGDCQPCNGYSYAPSPSNPSTPCGCK